MIKTSFKPASAEFSKTLLAEAEHRLMKIKTAEIIRESMAAQIGVGDLKNSPMNTEWSIPPRTARIKQIEQNIEETFKPYLYSLINGKQHGIVGGIHLPDDQKQFPDELPATLVLRFNFKRSILPLSTTAPEANKKATNALHVLDSALNGGFSKFIDDIEGNNIPLMPYFHTSQRSIKQGGLNQEDLHKFIGSESARYSQNPLKKPDGTPLSTGKFYKPHMHFMQQGQAIRPTYQHGFDRRYDNKDIDDISDHTILLRAISFKLQQGYTANMTALKEGIINQMNFFIKQNHAQVTKDPSIRMSYEKFYTRKYSLIEDAFRNGCLEEEGNADRPSYSWGQMPDTHRRGLPTKNTGKHTTCPTLDLGDLRLILKCLTVPNPAFATGRQLNVGPNEFVVPGQKRTYSSNGWDSVPGHPEQRSWTLSAMKELPTGQIVYDRDQGNFGRSHLLKYWFMPTGKGLRNIIYKWGPWADGALKKLQSQQVVDMLRKNNGQPDKVALDAWANVIGSENLGNRTNAETLLELLNQYPSYQDFYANHLQKGLSAEFNAYNKLANPKYMPTDPMEQQAKRLTEQLKAGQLTWNEYTKVLTALQSKSKAQFITPLKDTEKRSMIGRNDYELLKRFGYQVAKMMDFVYAIMTRSCEEQFTNREDGKTEKFYGRQYSTSTGKSEEGQVMLGVRYAYNAPEIASADPNLQKLVRKQRGKRHIKIPGDTGDVYRQTQHPQKGTPIDQEFAEATPTGTIIKIVENVTYWVGMASSTSKWHKPIYDNLDEGLSWAQALDYLMRKYPDIQKQLGVLFEPMNVDLQRLQNSSKRALTKVQDELAQQGQSTTIVYVNKDKQTTVLDKEAQSLDDFHPNVPVASQQIAQAPAPTPAAQPTAPVSPQNVQPANLDNTMPPTSPVATPDLGLPDSGKKQMPMAKNRITKGPKSTLIRNRNSYVNNDAIVKIAQFCNKLDESNHIDLANQIDCILKDLVKN